MTFFTLWILAGLLTYIVMLIHDLNDGDILSEEGELTLEQAIKYFLFGLLFTVLGFLSLAMLLWILFDENRTLVVYKKRSK